MITFKTKVKFLYFGPSHVVLRRFYQSWLARLVLRPSEPEVTLFTLVGAGVNLGSAKSQTCIFLCTLSLAT